jgi:hypothetical protein
MKTGNKNGSKWITRQRRLAIYLRDGMACVYCCKGVEDGITLTLDHRKTRVATVKPDNSTRNLLTACMSCNATRQNKSLSVFARHMAENAEVKDAIMRRVSKCVSRDIGPYTDQAKQLLADRPFIQAVHTAKHWTRIHFENSKKAA